MTMPRTLLTGLLLFAAAMPLLAQYTNVRVSNAGSRDPNEVSIAINPINPLELAAGANLNYLYRSTNGGQSWTQSNLSSATYGVWGDPCLLYDAAGNLYYGHLSNPPSGGYWIDRIVVQKSTNGGATWNSGAGIGFRPPAEQDKEWLAVDMTNSPYRNFLYVTWTDFDNYGSSNPTDSTRIRCSRSTDGGITWSAPVRVSERAGDCIDSDNTVEGAVPAVGPNGEVMTAWSGPIGIMFDKSTDGGVTFGTDVFVSTQPGGWDFNVSGINRCNGLPITACDISNGPYRGTIYVNWSDQRNGLTNTDVFISKSVDGGQTWSAARRLNDDLTQRHQFFTWMTIDQSNGFVYCVFYDRRTTSGDATDVYVARSTDGGESFTNFRVSESSFVPNASAFFGDYTNIAALNGKVYPLWMRGDGTQMSVWTALIDESIAPLAPALLYPPNDAAGMNTRLTLRWRPSAGAASYHVQVATDSQFVAPAIDDSTVSDTTRQLQGLSNLTTYYWRVRAKNSSGSSTFSPAWRFTTYLPLPGPVSLLAPATGATISADSVLLLWNRSQPQVVRYCLESARDSLFAGSIVDSTIVDTMKVLRGLLNGEYWWRVRGKNIAGWGTYSETRRFAVRLTAVTASPGEPDKFAVNQNYPNPFNPTTTIEFSVPHHELVSLKVYNVLGQEVATLVNRQLEAGMYRVVFEAAELPSGVYLYRLTGGSSSETKRMVLLR